MTRHHDRSRSNHRIARTGVALAMLCCFTTPPGTLGGTVTGSVLDAVTDEAIPAAQVTITVDKTQRTAHTNAAGKYTCTNIPAGKVRMVVKADDYVPDGKEHDGEEEMKDDPGTLEINETLYSKKKDEKYAAALAEKLKQRADVAGADAVNIYKVAWADLATAPTVMKAHIAKNVVAADGRAGSLPGYGLYATAEPAQIEEAEQEVQNWVGGKTFDIRIDKFKNVDAKIVADMTASELSRQSIDFGMRQKFVDQFRGTFGPAATDRLQSDMASYNGSETTAHDRGGDTRGGGTRDASDRGGGAHDGGARGASDQGGGAVGAGAPQ